MKKEYVALLVVTLLVSGLFVGDYFFNIMGFTTLSLSQAFFTSSSDFFDGEVWIMTVVQGGMAQKAQGTMEREDIGAQSGEYPLSDFEIDITYSKQWCEYGIAPNDAAEPIMKYSIHEWQCAYFTYADADKNCPNGHVYGGKYSLSLTCFCIEEVQQTGRVAYRSIGNPYVHTVSDIAVSKSGLSPAVKRIDTSGEIRGYINDFVYVIWNGYLVRDTCQTQEPYYAWYEQRWHLGQSVNYERYLNVKDTYLNILVGSKVTTKATVINHVATINSAADTSMQEAWFEVSMEDASSVENAKIFHVVSSQIGVPVYTFFVKADWLGIYQPVAAAQIVDAKGDEFKTKGVLYALVKNIGDERGGFDTYATCTDPFAVTSPTKSFTLEAGETRPVYLDISVDVAQPTSGSCTICTQTLDSKDCETVVVKADPEQVCTPNRRVCDYDSIKQCNPYGSGWELEKDCKLENKVCEYDSMGNPVCVKKGVVDCKPWDLWCWLNKFTSPIMNQIVDMLYGGLKSVLMLLGVLSILVIVVYIAIKKVKL